MLPADLYSFILGILSCHLYSSIVHAALARKLQRSSVAFLSQLKPQESTTSRSRREMAAKSQGLQSLAGLSGRWLDGYLVVC